MPFVGVVHLAIAAFFGIHAVRSGQPIYWLFVLFAFPLLGSVVYCFAIYLPQWRYTHGGRKAARTVQNLVDPHRELREASAEFDRTPTAYNRARLAAALLAKGHVDEAIEHYRATASGAYASDATFLAGLARAEIAAGRHGDAAATLERLFASHPEQCRGALAIAHAEALAGAGSANARAAFEAVVAKDASTEAQYKYGAFLHSRGDQLGARRAFEAVLRNAEHGHVPSRELNCEWIAQAKVGLQQMET
ncbi:MAG TPA: tetratricopeptide repeat protein [Caldimonas sp.]